MVALMLKEQKTFVIYDEVLGTERNWHGCANKFVELYEKYKNALPEGVRSRDFVRNCVTFSFEIPDLVWHGKYDMNDSKWVSPIKISKIVEGLLSMGFFLESDPYPRIAKESWLD